MGLDAIDQFPKLIQFLLDFPVEKHPYPDGWPDELKFDNYPGKDYVIGLCEEAIDELSGGLIGANKELCVEMIDIYKRIRKRRIRMLAEAKQPKEEIEVASESTKSFDELVIESLM